MKLSKGMKNGKRCIFVDFPEDYRKKIEWPIWIYEEDLNSLKKEKPKTLI